MTKRIVIDQDKCIMAGECMKEGVQVLTPHLQGRGLARQLMEVIHQWCRDRGLKTVGLNASEFGRPLYESLGYRLPETLMILSFEDD